MTETEHLLTCLMEECSEVIKNTSKCLRFGLDDADPFKNQPVSNAKTVALELTDLVAVAQMLVERGVIPPYERLDGIMQKKAKVMKMMDYARKRKTVQL